MREAYQIDVITAADAVCLLAREPDRLSPVMQSEAPAPAVVERSEMLKATSSREASS
jgi:hypothetical protein